MRGSRLPWQAEPKREDGKTPAWDGAIFAGVNAGRKLGALIFLRALLSVPCVARGHECAALRAHRCLATYRYERHRQDDESLRAVPASRRRAALV